MEDTYDIPTLEGRIAELKRAIAKTREGATAETLMAVDVAIEVLAMPELRKLEARLAEAIDKSHLAYQQRFKA